MKKKINVTVKTIPHPDPQRAIDVTAEIVLKRLLKEGKVTGI